MSSMIIQQKVIVYNIPNIPNIPDLYNIEIYILLYGVVNTTNNKIII